MKFAHAPNLLGTSVSKAAFESDSLCTVFPLSSRTRAMFHVDSVKIRNVLANSTSERSASNSSCRKTGGSLRTWPPHTSLSEPLVNEVLPWQPGKRWSACCRGGGVAIPPTEEQKRAGRFPCVEAAILGIFAGKLPLVLQLSHHKRQAPYERVARSIPPSVAPPSQHAQKGWIGATRIQNAGVHYFMRDCTVSCSLVTNVTVSVRQKAG